MCIKREEEDDQVNGTATVSDGSMTEVTTVGGHPGLTWRLSSCQDMDLRHTCTTRIFGPSVRKTVTTNYECCPGYALNVKEQECQRGEVSFSLKFLGFWGAIKQVLIGATLLLQGDFKRLTKHWRSSAPKNFPNLSNPSGSHLSSSPPRI